MLGAWVVSVFMSAYASTLAPSSVYMSCKVGAKAQSYSRLFSKNHVGLDVCVRVRAHTCASVCLCVCVCMCLFDHTCVCACACACACVCLTKAVQARTRGFKNARLASVHSCVNVPSSTTCDFLLVGHSGLEAGGVSLGSVLTEFLPSFPSQIGVSGNRKPPFGPSRIGLPGECFSG